jgi:hypothetical protein
MTREDHVKMVSLMANRLFQLPAEKIMPLVEKATNAIGVNDNGINLAVAAGVASCALLATCEDLDDEHSGIMCDALCVYIHQCFETMRACDTADLKTASQRS